MGLVCGQLLNAHGDLLLKSHPMLLGVTGAQFVMERRVSIMHALMLLPLDYMLVTGVIQELFPLYHARISSVRQGPTFDSERGFHQHLAADHGRVEPRTGHAYLNPEG